jgi:hypothetical protein
LEGKSICPAQKKELTRKLKKAERRSIVHCKSFLKKGEKIMKKGKNTKG